MIGSNTARLTVLPALIAILSGTPFVSENAFGTLESAATQESGDMEPLTLKTDNGSVNVIVSWKPQEIEPDQEVTFTVGYRDASSDQWLEHINHDFKIMDEGGVVIKSHTGLHTHSGYDLYTVTFPETGNFNLEVTILGLGINQPFDTTRSGTAESAIVVVPEFPAVFISILTIAAVASVVVYSRARSILFAP